MVGSEGLPEGTVVWGAGERRGGGGVGREGRRKAVERMVEGLRALVPSNRAKFVG